MEMCGIDNDPLGFTPWPCSVMAEERGEKSAADLVLEGQELADTILVPVRCFGDL